MKYFIESRFNKESLDLKNVLANKLKQVGFIEDKDNPEVVIIMGGDGKMLKSLRYYFNRLDSIKFIGINTGTLGFFSDYNKDELDELVNDLKENKFNINEYNLLEISTNISDRIYYAMNELRLEHRFYSTKLNIYINGEFFECAYGNGVNISTSFGSSGYNKSINGPLVNPKLETMVLSEVASIQFNNQLSLHNSLVLCKNDTITVKSDDFPYINIGVDNFLLKERGTKEITVKLSDKKVIFLNRINFPYYERVRNKFLR